ncbi:hypothetical protein Dimus_029151 [Dionaea muscipula]
MQAWIGLIDGSLPVRRRIGLKSIIGMRIDITLVEVLTLTLDVLNELVSPLTRFQTTAWEEERKTSFVYEGVQLETILEEYKLTRMEREEEKKRHWDYKKL